MKHCEYMDSDWFKALTVEAATTNKTVVARKMQINRSTLSAVMNGIGEYGKGKASTSGVELQFRRAFEQLECPHTFKIIGITTCRENALGAAPTHNPRQTMQWQACQACPHKPAPIQAPEKAKATKKAKEKAFATTVRPGSATSGTAAEQEGWDCTGGPMDNPYPIEDQRHDYWELGYKSRREFDRKQKERFRKIFKEDVQQAGIIDKVTLPLPEVGGPQIAELTSEVGT
ncbi:MAG: hypothetical protein WA071_27930 [Undibacterium umbellatum]|uniref:hypothetical protein n=1 Tax=Undibacterium umbellatum TaxID=2762300 RepID=UPI003BB5815A